MDHRLKGLLEAVRYSDADLASIAAALEADGIDAVTVRLEADEEVPPGRAAFVIGHLDAGESEARSCRSGGLKRRYSRAGIFRLSEPPQCVGFPEREILIDILQKSMIISRSVNIMAKRTLTPAEIGDIVRTTRKAAGLRQDELAGAAGVGLRFIVDLEAGIPTAQIGKTLQVLAALGCYLAITPPPEPKGARKA